MAYILIFYIAALGMPGVLSAQEEESAAVSLEENTDEFQENFFEALKQKGIENYDKAIENLLECKRLDPASEVVDYELAKAYLLNGQPFQAMEYGTKALNSDPTNGWYLEILVSAALQQGNTLNMLKERIPYENTRLQENLARILYAMKEYQSALSVIREMDPTDFSEQLSAKIQDSISQKEDDDKIDEQAENPLDAYRNQLVELLDNQKFKEVDTVSAEALEKFPSFPYFYYIRGLVLNRNAQYKEASSILEEGLDFLLDDPALAENMYRELAKAYTGQGNTSKANMYLSKIKSGS